MIYFFHLGLADSVVRVLFWTCANAEWTTALIASLGTVFHARTIFHASEMRFVTLKPEFYDFKISLPLVHNNHSSYIRSGNRHNPVHSVQDILSLAQYPSTQRKRLQRKYRQKQKVTFS